MPPCSATGPTLRPEESRASAHAGYNGGMSLMQFQRVDFSVGGPLLLEHVEPSAGEMTRGQGGFQRGLVDDAAAGRVHEERALLHARDPGGVEHARVDLDQVGGQALVEPLEQYHP